MHLREENYWAREGEIDVSGGDVGNASLGVRIIYYEKTIEVKYGNNKTYKYIFNGMSISWHNQS